MKANKSSFNLVFRNKSSFSFALTGFVFAVTFFFRIRERINIEIVPSLISKLFTTVKGGIIRNSYTMKIQQKVTQVISARRVKVSYVMKQRMKNVIADTMKIPIVFSLRERQKVQTLIKTGILSISIIPILALFYTLGDYDPDTIGSMDATTLGDLDFST